MEPSINQQAGNNAIQIGVAYGDVTINITYQHPSPGVPFQAPPLPACFVPRPEYSEPVKEQLFSTAPAIPGVLVVSAIQGLGGIGKSVLATSLAHEKTVQEHFPEGVLWVTLGQQPEVLSLLSGWIQALGDYIFRPTSPEAATAHLRSLLNDKACLLVIDDAWQVEHTLPFLVGGARCRIIVTTRDALIARAVGAELYNMDVMTPDQALALLRGKLGRPLKNDEVDIVLQFADAAGFLPLALELAAAQVVEGVSWQELFNDLGAEIARLESLDLPGVDEVTDEKVRKRFSLRASLNLSISRLSSERKTAFAWLGILPEDVLLNSRMAATVWDSDERSARELLRYFRDKALLLPGPSLDDRWTYRVHDLVHYLARELLYAPEPEGLNLSGMAAHAAYLGRCQAKISAGLWHTLPVDDYIHAHLTWHMEKAGMIEAVFALLNEETAAGKNGWYEVCERLGQTSIFTANLQHAWVLAGQQDQIETNAISQKEALVRKARLALINASINSLATEIPPFLFEALVETGTWSAAQALAYARSITNQKILSSVLTRLSRHIPAHLLGEFLLLAQKIEASWDCAEALIAFIPYLNPAQLSSALEIARAIPVVQNRIEVLIELVPHLPEARRNEVWEEALAAVKTITNDQSNSRAQAMVYAKMARSLPEPLLHRILGELPSWWWNEDREILSIEFAPVLAGYGFQDEALEMARKIDNRRERARACIRLLPYLEQPLQDQVWNGILADIRKMSVWELHMLPDWVAQLAKARQIEAFDAGLAAIRADHAGNNEEHRAEALARLAPHLPAGLLPQALEIALDSPSEWHRAVALLGLIPYLSAPLRLDVLAAARQIEHEGHRGLLLAALVPFMPGSLYESVLQETLAAIRQSDWDERRVEVFARITPHLSEPLRSQVLQEALISVEKIKKRSMNSATAAGSLEKLAPHLSEPLLDTAIGIAREKGSFQAQEIACLAPQYTRLGLLEKALQVAQTIQNHQIKAQALVNIALILPADQQGKVLQAALDSVWLAGDESDLARISAQCMPYLDESSRSLAFHKILSIESSRDKVSYLLASAPYFPDQAVQPALAAAAGIQNDFEKRQAFITLAPYLLEHDLTNALDEALKTVEAYSFWDIIDKFLPHLTPDQIIRLFASLQSQLDYYAPHSMIVKLVPFLPERLQVKTAREVLFEKPGQVSFADQIRLSQYLSEPERSEVCRQVLPKILLNLEGYSDLADIIPSLPGEFKLQAVHALIDAVRGVGDIYPQLANQGSQEKARIFIQLTPELSGDLKREITSEAFDLFKDMPFYGTDYVRAVELLSELIPNLPDERIEDAFIFVSHMYSSVGVEYNVYTVPLDKPWSTLLPRLPERLMKKVLNTIRVIHDTGVKLKVFSIFVRYLPVGQEDEVISVARSFSRPADRAEAMCALAVVIAKGTPAGIWEETLAAVRLINSPVERARAAARAIIEMPKEIYRDKIYEICLGVIKDLSFKLRKDLLEGLWALTPVLLELGGEKVILETYRAVLDVADWWP